MKKRIQTLLKIDLVKNNVIFLIGTLVISFFNYLYYPVLSRLVSVSDFGEIQATISIFMQLGILLTAFGYVVTNITNNKTSDQSKVDILHLERFTLLISVLTLFVLISFGNYLQTTFQFSSALPLLLVGLLVILNVPSTSRSYVLQGMRFLKSVSISGIIFSLGKLVVTVILILVGVGVEGAIIGYIIAQAITLLYLETKTKNFFPSVISSFRKLGRVPVDFGKELKYGLVVLVLLSGVAALYSFDVVVARLFFSAEVAGEYSGVSSVARIIYFATASVAGVLIASVRLDDSYSKSRSALAWSGLVVSLIGLFILLVFTLFPSLSIYVLLGSTYSHVAHLLPYTSLFMLVAAINNLLIAFQIARRRQWSIFAIAAGVVSLIALLAMNHNTVTDLITAYLLSNCVVFVILIVQIARRSKNE